ncbi:virulence factor [Thalassobacillus cyri]|uniref:Virulence factor n=1 Tax=Thalassobacillus cyri TaxID=571932 RepID=A0A1H4EFJ7_9BACI|nr:Gfo/Idh/MocA family oxidoreductase [Thalassobacillus cyri]SEA83589.1 virulence factor [Thalassobacillus cyri]
MKVGMIGLGGIAKKAYLPVLTQTAGIELHVCTRNGAVLEEVKEKYRIRHTYQNIDTWLQSGIKAAFVHSATESHEAIIDQLLDRGIHVYVDKPITNDGESASRLMEKAKKNGLLLRVGFNRRYAPSYQKLKELKYPNMMVMEKNRSRQAGDVREVIFDDFIHVIDTLLYLFPYQIDDIRIHGNSKDGKLQHVILQLIASEGTAIGMMNREAGANVEKVELMNASETWSVMNVSEIATHKDKDVLIHGNNDWEPTLMKRGFHSVTASFLEAVEKGATAPYGYSQDLEPHLIAERIVQYIGE